MLNLLWTKGRASTSFDTDSISNSEERTKNFKNLCKRTKISSMTRNIL